MLYVGLFRGINVGGNNKVSMTDLTALFEDLGFTKLKPYINSGNMIFEDDRFSEPQLVEMIQKAIQAELGLSIITQLRSKSEIDRVNAAIPEGLKNDAETKADVLFLSKEIDSPRIVEQLEPREGVDHIIYTPGAVIWHLEKANYARGSMHKLIGTKLYAGMTVRNVNTVRKLAQLMA